MISLPNELSDFQVLHPIGFGAFSRVYLAVHLPTQLNVSIKIVQKKGSKHSTEDEIRLLQSLCHPLIPRIFTHAEDTFNYYIVMEYAEGGNLLQYVNSHGVLSTSSVRRVLLQLIIVLEFLGNIIHRDIKTENILLDRNNNIRLTDFGLAVEANGLNLTSLAGSPNYVSPEIIRGQNYGKPSDIWSMGIVVYCCAVGYFPFFSGNNNEMLYSILTDEIVFPNKIDQDLEDIIRKMLEKDQKDRITIEEIKEHPFLKSCEGQLNMPSVEIDFSETKDISNIIVKRHIETEQYSSFGIIEQNDVMKPETDEHKSIVQKVQKELSKPAKDPMAFLAKRIVRKGKSKRRMDH